MTPFSQSAHTQLNEPGGFCVNQHSSASSYKSQRAKEPPSISPKSPGEEKTGRASKVITKKDCEGCEHGPEAVMLPDQGKGPPDINYSQKEILPWEGNKTTH